ncbi:hypothetical protein YPPY34_1709, partial [Yersinia pestis PY-34]
MKQDSFT